MPDPDPDFQNRIRIRIFKTGSADPDLKKWTGSATLILNMEFHSTLYLFYVYNDIRINLVQCFVTTNYFPGACHYSLTTTLYKYFGRFMSSVHISMYTPLNVFKTSKASAN